MSTSVLTAALKEWAVAVHALIAGETILLLRKGGIREQKFTIASPQIWLYPTYEHQKPYLLKPAYASQVLPVESGWHPPTVEIQAQATITHSYEITEPAIVEALLPFHIWNAEFVSERLKWKARSPLTVLLLRIYTLPTAQSIPYRAEYGGCKSWIDLQADLLSPTTAVLDDSAYQAKVKAIQVVLGAA
ncbi:DUF1802 family protein [Phormidium tenue FACHB-886]|nr:DUF1802 family protein [Phormidium tenue FACHB-886]